MLRIVFVDIFNIFRQCTWQNNKNLPHPNSTNAKECVFIWPKILISLLSILASLEFLSNRDYSTVEANLYTKLTETSFELETDIDVITALFIRACRMSICIRMSKKTRCSEDLRFLFMLSTKTSGLICATV